LDRKYSKEIWKILAFRGKKQVIKCWKKLRAIMTTNAEMKVGELLNIDMGGVCGKTKAFADFGVD